MLTEDNMIWDDGLNIWLEIFSTAGRKRTEPYDTLHTVHVLTVLAVAPPAMTLFIFIFNSSFGTCCWETFDDLAPRFSVGPIIAFVAADGALEVEALPSFLDFPIAPSSSYVSCTNEMKKIDD